MFSNGVCEYFSEGISLFCFNFFISGSLNEGVGVCVESVFVGSFLGQGVVDKHVEGEEVYDCLLPGDWSVGINQLYAIQPIVFYFSHCAFMREISLPGDII
jgi:hypothetical protein